MTTLVKLYWSAIYTFIKPIIILLLINMTKDIMKTIEDIIIAMQSTDLTGEEKRAEAIRQIKYYLIQQGIFIKDHLLNLVIEILVAKNKS